MANYNIVIDTSQFRPFDYSLALNAIHDYNTGYEKQQAVYDKIAQTLGDLASAVEGSTRAKQIYDTYQQQFNTAASDFANGMNIRNARDLANLRKVYGTQIRQLERANEAMVKEAERRRIAKPEHNMLYQNMGNLDDWMENPNRVLGSYSGTQLTNEVSALAAAAGKDIIRRYNDGSLDKFTKLWVEKKGLSSENVNKAVQEVQQGGIENVTDPVMKGILQNAMQASGIYNWADEQTKRTAEQLAARGLYGGIGQATMGTYEDYANKKAADYYYDELKAKNQQQRALELLKAKNEQDFNNSLGGTYGRSYLEEVEGNGNTKYQNLQTRMQSLIGTDGKLKPEYRAARGKVGDPMKIYEDYQNYLNTHRSYTPSVSSRGGKGVGMGVIASTPTKYEEAMDYIKKKYGVTSIISTDQYNTMKALGYNGTDFAMNHGGVTNYDMSNYNERLNNLASRKTTSYASGDKVTQAIASRIGKGLVHYQSDNALKEVNGQLKPVSASDWDDITTEDIGEVGIDIGAEKVVFVMKDGTKYAVDPNIISTNFQNKWNTGIQLKQNIENSNYTDAQKAQALYELQETVLTWLMKECGRDIFQVKGETSNNE